MTRIIKKLLTYPAAILSFLIMVALAASLFQGIAYAQSANPYSCPAPQPTKRLGDAGLCVQHIQWILNTKYGATPRLDEEEGKFNADVEEFVKSWQRTHNLTVDGVVGPKTWSSFNCTDWDFASASCKDPGAATTPSATNTTTGGVSAGCSKIEQNFTEFGGGTPGPLANNCYTPGEGVNKVIKIAFTLVGILTVLFIVIGGFRYMTSAGDEKRAGSGKKTIQWALIGLVLVLFAYAIVTISTRLATTSQLF